MENDKFQDLVLKQLSALAEGQNELTKEVIELGQSQVRMENELTEKVRALFDAREVQSDVNERLISTLERIEAKVDVLQLETAHLRRVK